MASWHVPQSRGFTLVEMLIIAPIVILAIGAFIALVVNLTGEVMSSRGANVLAYDIQDALNRIEADTKLSNASLAVNNINIATTRQGYVAGGSASPTGSTVNFTNVDKTASGGSPASLILNSLITNGNPLSANTMAVFLANKPNDCSDPTAYAKNTPMTMNVVYYITNNTLWRRVIMPSNYANAAIRCGSAPWQQPSCAPGYTVAFCATNDQKLIEGVTPADFSVQYFTTASASSPITTATNPATSDANRNTALQSSSTLLISLTARRTIAGRDITSSGSVRVTRLDTNASAIAKDSTPTTAPQSPTVTSSVSDGHVVTFRWPNVATATSYALDYRINGGAWVSGSTNIDNATSSFVVSQGGHTDTVEARVTAKNAAGTSGYGSSVITIPLWASLPLQNGWTDYAQSYSSAAYTKTKTGLVMFKGLIKNPTAQSGNTIIGKVPADYAPTGNLIFGVTTGNGGNDPGRIDVDSAGNVRFNTGGIAWISLEMLRYLPDSAPYTRTAPPLLAGWVNYGGVYAPASYAVIPSTGRTVTQGLVKSGTITDGTDIFSLPAGVTSSEYLHMASYSTSWAHIGITGAAQGLEAKGTGTNGFLSVNSTYLSSSSTATWTNLALQNGWVNYGGVFATAQYTKTSDDIVQLKGLIRSGSTTYGSLIATLPPGFRPKSRLLMTTVNTAAHARIDILPDGQVLFLGANNGWYALDDINFVAEQ